MMTENTNTPAQLVESIVKELVEEPDAVEVMAREEGYTTIIEIKVAPQDAGKVIGRQGRVVRALRMLARASSSYTGGSHVEVEILN